MASRARIGVVGGTGAVGSVTLGLLREHGFDDVRVFASARSAGKQVAGLTVEEATPEALARGDVDVFLFSVGTGASRELVPHAVSGGATAIDKSSAYRLEPGIPLVVPEVNGGRALEHDLRLNQPGKVCVCGFHAQIQARQAGHVAQIEARIMSGTARIADG